MQKGSHSLGIVIAALPGPKWNLHRHKRRRSLDEALSRLTTENEGPIDVVTHRRKQRGKSLMESLLDMQHHVSGGEEMPWVQARPRCWWREAQQDGGGAPTMLMWVVDEEISGGQGSFTGEQASGIGLLPPFRPPANRGTWLRFVMRNNLGLTPVPCLTATAYFDIREIYIPRACCRAKRYGSLIDFFPISDLTPEVECCLAKGY